MSFVRAGDLVVHYALSGPGDAPVVVMANSLGSSLDVWDPQAAALAQRFRVLRYDLRGHGLTDVGRHDSSGYSIELLAGDVIALLDALHIERVHFCGLSIGGLIGQRLAANVPERVDSLVLCSTASRIGSPPLWDERVATILRDGIAGIVEGVLARWFTPRMHAERPDVVRGFANMLLRTPVDGYVGCALAVRNADLRQQLASIRCPTLVIAGAEDVSTPPAAASELRDAIDVSELRVLDGAAHIVTIERSHAVNAHLLRFLEMSGRAFHHAAEPYAQLDEEDRS